MADTKISALTAVTTPADGDKLAIVNSATTKAITMSNLAAAVASRLTASTLDEQNCFVAREEQSSGTDGGGFTSGSWQDRVLNTLENQTPSYVSLASNTLTVPAGKWLVFWVSPAHAVGSHQSRLLVDGSTGYPGINSYMLSGASTQLNSMGFAILDESSSFTIKLQGQCETTRATDGFGKAHSFGTEVYGTVVGIRLGDAT